MDFTSISRAALQSSCHGPTITGEVPDSPPARRRAGGENAETFINYRFSKIDFIFYNSMVTGEVPDSPPARRRAVGENVETFIN